MTDPNPLMSCTVNHPPGQPCPGFPHHAADLPGRTNSELEADVARLSAERDEARTALARTLNGWRPAPPQKDGRMFWLRGDPPGMHDIQPMTDGQARAIQDYWKSDPPGRTINTIMDARQARLTAERDAWKTAAEIAVAERDEEGASSVRPSPATTEPLGDQP